MKNWAEKMAKVLMGSYESYVDEGDLKEVVCIYAPKGIFYYNFNKLKRMIPKNFKLTGIFYCTIEKQIYLLINEK